jgi:transcriptional regulator with XRE-family HTH domain
MPTPGSPSVRRRRLAIELRRLRESSEQSRKVTEVAQALGWSPAKVSRYELGRTGLKPEEVEKLLDLYAVVEPQRGQLLALAHEAARRGWWEDFADAISEDYQAFIGLEAEATSIAQWQVEVLPGLLQTEAYARQVMQGYQRVMPIPPGVVDRRVKVRTIRQEVLTREEPLNLSVVVDESVLLRKIGDRSLMYQQLKHLAEAARLPNVTLQVLPLSNDSSLVASSFTIFRFGSDGETTLHDVVCTENLRAEFYVEGEGATYEYRLGYRALADSSLDPGDSQQLISKIAEQKWA